MAPLGSFARPETGLVGRGHFRSEARSRVLHEPLGWNFKTRSQGPQAPVAWGRCVSAARCSMGCQKCHWCAFAGTGHLFIRI